MPILSNYNSFNGRHWETGSVHNYFAGRGVKAPHTGQPYSEAFLLGLSGGIVMGYFVFNYEGYDPMPRILTRNTFDPMDTLLERLGGVQEIEHTAKADKAVNLLVESLENGVAPIVWADTYSLPYQNSPELLEEMWAMNPLVVYGYDEPAGTVLIADRANVPLTITTAELAAARGRIKKFKNRILNLDPPNVDKLASAVQMSIWACIKLFTERPPKGGKNSFGFAAYRTWADMLVKTKGRRTWAKEFPAGSALYSGLTESFYYTNLFGQRGAGDRPQYADFLEEAAVLLNRPALAEVGQKFRASGKAWEGLNLALLPDEVEPLRQVRELMIEQDRLFIESGQATLDEQRQIIDQLAAIKAEVTADFPLDEAGIQQLRANIADNVMAIHDIEFDAVMSLQEAMG